MNLVTSFHNFKNLFNSVLLHYKSPVDCINDRGYSPLFQASKIGSIANIIQLLEHGADVNYTSKNEKTLGKTPIFKARSAETIKLLLKYGADPRRIVTSNQGIPVTAIEHLMKFNTICPEAILDEYLYMQSDDTLIMDFVLFENSHTSNKKKVQDDEMSLFISTQKNYRHNLLLHPLMQIFLGLKFSTVDTLFALQLIYDVSLTIIWTALGIHYVDFTNCVNHDNGTAISSYTGNVIYTEETSINSTVKCHLNTVKPRFSDNNAPALNVICIALGYTEKCWYDFWLIRLAQMFLAIFFAKEAYQFLQQGYKAYITSLENWIEFGIIMLSIAFIVISNDKMDLAAHCAGWMIFLVWIDLILLFGKSGRLGDYIFMSVYVTRTMLICMVTYIPCFLAFSFGFYIFLKPSDKFNSYTATIIKVLSMMVGELNYGDEFAYDAVDEVGGRNISTQIMFVLFLISITLIIMNLLLAVTISKTEDLVNQSRLMQATRRIDDVILSTSSPIWFDKLIKTAEKYCCKMDFLEQAIIARRTPILKRFDQGLNERNYKVKQRTFKTLVT